MSRLLATMCLQFGVEETPMLIWKRTQRLSSGCRQSKLDCRADDGT